MPTDTEASATAPTENVGTHAAEAIKAAADQGRQTIAEAAKMAENAIREAIEMLREQTKSYREDAERQLDDAQRYLTERVKERPLTAVTAGLGVGLLLGLLLSNRSR